MQIRKGLGTPLHSSREEKKKLLNDSFRCPLRGETFKTLTDGSSDVDGLSQACSNLMVLQAIRKKIRLHA
jgi:hypothetical protein